MRIPFAMNRSGQLVSVDEVERGKKCECTCPECGSPVVACKGEFKRAYFAHAAGADCAIGYESSLHKAVKHLLDQHKELLLPDCYVRLHTRFMPDVFEYQANDWRTGYRHPRDYDIAYPETGVGHVPGRMVRFDAVRLEQQEGDVRPDIIGYIGDVPLFIEVAVTHFVDDDKERKLRARGASVIELDFSDHDKSAWTWDALKTRLFEQTKGKKWLINVKAEQKARIDHAERGRRVAPLLEQLALAEEKKKKAAELAKKYEPKYLFRFDTLGYYSSCRVLLSEACISTNLENSTDVGLKAAFEKRMAELGAVYSRERRNYEFPSSEEFFFSWPTSSFDDFPANENTGYRRRRKIRSAFSARFVSPSFALPVASHQSSRR